MLQPGRIPLVVYQSFMNIRQYWLRSGHYIHSCSYSVRAIRRYSAILTIIDEKTDARSDLMENPMSGGPDSLILRFLRTIDGKLDRVLDEVSEMKYPI